MMKKLLIISCLFGLSACLGGYSPDSNFYRLPLLNQSAQTFNTVKSISVSKVGLPEYLDRPQMITIDETSPKIEIAEFHRWGENLSGMIQRKTANDLSLYLPAATIADSAEEIQKANWDVKIEIIRLDMIKQGKVLIEAKWYISNDKGKVVKSGSFIKTQNIKAKYEEYAAEAANLLGEMNLEIAQALSKI